ncbi:hypothetical protein RND81_09G009200 [Saponaria officinalis]|uniref:Uncharacterized protein n=1 Tax=Saponaria officinalis TaxID=3572 RepID=A0AAW1IG02_SAPOF
MGFLDHCFVVSTLWNLRMFAELTHMNFKPTYEELLECDFRNLQDYKRNLGGQPKLLLEYCMRNKVFSAYSKTQAFSPSGKTLSGYMRVFPLREDFLLRSIAQQPILVVMTEMQNQCCKSQSCLS